MRALIADRGIENIRYFHGKLIILVDQFLILFPESLKLRILALYLSFHGRDIIPQKLELVHFLRTAISKSKVNYLYDLSIQLFYLEKTKILSQIYIHFIIWKSNFFLKLK